MKYVFTSQFLKINPPETSFADAWEAFCSDLLRFDLKNEECKKLVPSLVDTYDDLNFIPLNNNPISESNCYLANTCAMLMVAAFSTNLIDDPEIDQYQR